MFRSLLGLAALVPCLAAATACRPASDGDPRVVTLALANAPNNFDPRVGTDEISQRVHQLVYSNLLGLNERLEVVPGVASSWETPDDRTYLVHLRTGVRFHDGHELTSADVAYTFTSLIDPSFVSGRKGAYRMLAGVDVVDRYTVRFRLKEPFGSFPINLVMGIVPAGAGPDLRERPVGTGPYRLVEYAVDDRVVLKPFRDYVDGPPRNGGLVLKIVPDDTMRGLELRTGAADLVINDLSPDIAYQLEAGGRLHVDRGPGTDYTYLGFNLRDPILRDRRVRHAIGYAIDRDAIVKYLRRGLARPAVGVVPPTSWAFEPNVFAFTCDPARARRLLDEAGYRDPDGDGARPRFTLSLKVSTSEFYRLQAAVIQEDLKRVGIALDVRSYEFATLYADVLRGNFQMFTLQWVGVSDPDILRRVFHSNQMPPAGFNRGFYVNAEVDRLLDRATASIDDRERGRLYASVQRLVAEDAPYISLWYKTNIAVSQPSVRGLRLLPSTDFTVLKDVYKATGAEVAARN